METNKSKKLLALLLALCMVAGLLPAVALSAFASDVAAILESDDADYPAGATAGDIDEIIVSLDKKSLSLTVGDSETLTATVLKDATADGVSQDVTWSSSDPSVASVSNGTVTALKAGTTEITASATVDGQTYSNKCDVTVTAANPPAGKTEVTATADPVSVDYGNEEIDLADSITVAGLEAGTDYTVKILKIGDSDTNEVLSKKSDTVLTISKASPDTAVSVSVEVALSDTAKEQHEFKNGIDGDKTKTTVTVSVTVAKASLSSAEVTVSPASKDYNGSQQKADTVTVKLSGGRTLQESEYDVKYTTANDTTGAEQVTNAGTYTVKVSPKDGNENLDESANTSKTFTVKPATIADDDVTHTQQKGSGKEDKSKLDVTDTLTVTVSTSSPTTPTLHYAWKADEDSIGTDSNSYTITDSENTKAITVTITTDGNFAFADGSTSKTLSLGTVGKKTMTVEWTGTDSTYTYNGQPQGLDAKAQGKDATSGELSDLDATDYTLTYTGVDGTEYAESPNMPTNAGKYTATVAGTGDYEGSGDSKTFTIEKATAPTVNVSESSVNISVGDPAKTITVSIGKTATINDKPVVTATSGNTAAATVGTVTVTSQETEGGYTWSATFDITAKAAGEATVTVEIALANYTDITDQEITVNVTGSGNIPVTGVSMSEGVLSLFVGDSATLSVTFTPADATNKNVTWSSNKPEVANVDQTGKVTAVAAGSANITATTEDGGFIATCTVTVTPIAVTGVTLNKGTLSLNVGGSETLTATVAPSNATNKTVYWKSSNTAVATVDANGKVTAVAVGTATITATTADQAKTATCAVTVTAGGTTGGGTTGGGTTGGGTTGGGTTGGGTGTGTTPPPTVENPSTDAETGETTVEVTTGTSTTTADGKVTAKADISTEVMNEAVESAITEAAKQETAPVVEVKVETAAGTDNLEVTLPAESLKTLAATEDASLKIVSDLAEIQLDNAALDALAAEAKGSTVTLEVKPVGTTELGTAQKDVLTTALNDAGQPNAAAEVSFVDLSLISDNTPIHQYGTGKLTVTLPYKLPANRNDGDVRVYYMSDTGKTTQRCKDASFKDGKVTFTTNHLSSYVVSTVPLLPEFTDLVGDWYAAAVEWAMENRIAKGYSISFFGPDDPCTRAQFVTYLWRAVGSPEPTITVNPFTDVSEATHKDYYKAILWAAENGVTTGTTDTTFSPDATCERGQVVTFLWRYFDKPQGAQTAFTDIEANAYYAEAVEWAYGKDIAKGLSDTVFGASDPCNRAQTMTFLYRANLDDQA